MLFNGKLIYVAGPYRSKHNFQIYENIQNARNLACKVVELGSYPIVPHLSTIFMEGLQNDQFFIEGTMKAMSRCDAAIIAPNWITSSGTCGEIVEMLNLKKPVFFDISALRHWLKTGELSTLYWDGLKFASYNLQEKGYPVEGFLTNDNQTTHTDSSEGSSEG